MRGGGEGGEEGGRKGGRGRKRERKAGARLCSTQSILTHSYMSHASCVLPLSRARACSGKNGCKGQELRDTGSLVLMGL